VNLAAVASAGEVVFDDSRSEPRLNVDSFDALADILFDRQASLTANGNPGGTIAIRGHDLTVSDDDPVHFANTTFELGNQLQSRIAIASVTDGEVDHPGVGIDVDLRGDLELKNASLMTWTIGEGRGGHVRVRANEDMRVLGPAMGVFNITDIGILTLAASSGDAGDLDLEADRMIFDGRIDTGSRTRLSSGNTGDFSVRTRVLTAEGRVLPEAEGGRTAPAQIGTSVGKNASGRGGSVSIRADERIQLNRGGGIFATAASNATDEAQAGSITIETPQLNVHGGKVSASTEGPGDAGSIIITADRIEIIDSAVIETASTGLGDAGSIDLRADRSLTIRDWGAIRSEVLNLCFQNPACTANAGDITITAGDIELLERGSISSTGAGKGDGGDVTIHADSLLVSGVAEFPKAKLPDIPAIFAKSLISSGHIGSSPQKDSGAAGDVSIVADQVRVLDSGTITSLTLGAGPSGDVTITSDDIVVSGVNSSFEAFLTDEFNDAELGLDLARSAISAGSLTIIDPILGIVFQASGPAGAVKLRGGANSKLRVDDKGLVHSGTTTIGAGGNVHIDIARVSVESGGEIVASSDFLNDLAGDAGGVTIDAQHFSANDGSVIARSVSSDAGDIAIHARDGIELFGSTIKADVGGGDTTTGGNVELEADWVIVDDDSRVVADAFFGKGGNIEITTKALFAYPGSVISATSAFGLNGTVQVNAPETNLTAALARLSDRYLDSAMARDQCALAGAESRGSFVLGGGTGIPEAPDAPLPSFSIERIAALP
jgi:hypothetical protein